MADANVTRRKLVKTGTLSAGVLLTAALLLIVNYLGWKYHKRFDWTESRLYTLSERSEKVVGELKRDVRFVVFLPPEDELFEPVRELLSQYDAASQRVTVQIVDAEKNPVQAQQLVQQYGVSAPGVVVESGKDRRVINSDDLAERDFSAMQMGQAPQMTGFKGEQLFTGAILQLSEGRKPKVLFTTGHGERSLDDRDAHGLSSVQEILGPDNFELEEWASLGKPAVPAGTDLVVVAGPTGAFLKPELDALSAYLNQGGRMLVLVDPTLMQTAGSGLIPTGLSAWLAGYGVRMGENIVVDPPNTLPSYSAQVFFSNRYGNHPITTPLEQSTLPVLLNLARSVGAGEAAGRTVTQLLETSEEGWGENSLARLENVEKDDADVAGPVPLGVAVEGQDGAGKRPMRLVVYGDSDFATNQLVQGNPANAVLLSNSLNWLAAREALLTIPPKKTEQVRLSLTPGELRSVYLLTLLALPGLAVVLGTFVTMRRRR
ncbi:MAG TPA: GldG family protein [Thermoanaerobaculia bacterium]